MKFLCSILLFLCLSLTVLCQTPPIGLCKLNRDQMEKYLECASEEVPLWVMKEYDRCKNEIMPGTSDIDIIKKMCEDYETAKELSVCITPVVMEILEELQQIVEKCVNQVEG
ncbi:uncharacterized protein LOC111088123 [Limulus polyphemus]|uniref:Uncharacterized protein LOC111088123 n=1 Tax=Limulus polyphemus TaxID=6850 RepID=A0ABM1TAE1_LIMPO|nr:uncharacterized protein LOC111088123 [Limulus polyphemus]XP_022252848.1 uncharacterized protein LOC111088123 [Limulus polyphemus]